MGCPKAAKEFVSLEVPEAWDDEPDCNKEPDPAPPADCGRGVPKKSQTPLVRRRFHGELVSPWGCRGIPRRRPMTLTTDRFA